MSLNPAIHDLLALSSLRTSPEKFSDNYLKPDIEQTSRAKKNLIVIYAESLERTYFDTAIFPGIIKYLKNIESKSIDFSNIIQVPYTHNTIAGFVSSQCGIPLVATSHGNSMSGMDTFLQRAVYLGDLLHEQGYDLSFFGGADIRYAGKNKFFKTHNFHEFLGDTELRKRIPDKSNLNNWSLNDDVLLDIAYDRFTDLSKGNKPFGLFILTLGTHIPDGHISKSCKKIIHQEEPNKMLNAVTCTDYLISKFINKILQSPYAKETTIVLQSDHLAMKNSAYELLKLGNRKNLFMIFDTQLKRSKEIKKLGSTLDISPTILPFIGFKGTMGSGRDLLDPKVKKLRNKTDP